MSIEGENQAPAVRIGGTGIEGSVDGAFFPRSFLIDCNRNEIASMRNDGESYWLREKENRVRVHT